MFAGPFDVLRVCHDEMPALEIVLLCSFLLLLALHNGGVPQQLFEVPQPNLAASFPRGGRGESESCHGFTE